MWQFLNQLNIFVEYVVKKRHSKKHIYTGTRTSNSNHWYEISALLHKESVRKVIT